ncbi:HAD family hydrolase [Actinotalea sp.]|uniref:HAD family hydrolase n=1 Tax=Actinotalea sp. TaxID=1872145 RepID=UPI00356AB8D5
MTAGADSPGPSLDGVLFDIDDTLVDTKGAFAVALDAVRVAYLPHLPAGGTAELLESWRADAGGHYRAYTRGETTATAQRMARANALHAEFGGPPLDDAGFAAWDAVFESGFEAAWAAHDDARPVLDSLAATGLRIGALSNARTAYQTGKLRATGLADVPVLVGVDTLGVGKPAPEVFLEACRRLGTAPSRTAYVGDELDIDALAAARVGLVGVWIDRPGARRAEVAPAEQQEAARAGVRVIASLRELLGHLGLST